MSLPALRNPRFVPLEGVDRLAVTPLHLPRGWPGPLGPWELDRGFRLRVVAEDLMVMTLGPAARQAPRGQALARVPGPGEEALVLVLAPRGPSLDLLERALALPGQEGWTAACLVLLCDERQKEGGPSFAQMARAARRAGVPAARVSQEMPTVPFRGVDYFTPERTLRQLGRIGRRLARWAKWRRLVPF